MNAIRANVAGPLRETGVIASIAVGHAGRSDSIIGSLVMSGRFCRGHSINVRSLSCAPSGKNITSEFARNISSSIGRQIENF
jgi:hypothetical protein